jgi:bifunctional non-homologous end joining protein LigD
VFWIRDILHLNGQNLRSLPLVERKAQLQALAIFDLDGDCIRYVPHLSTNGIEFYHEAVEQGAPGIIARDAYSPYKSGTSKSWVRIATPTLLGSGSAAASGLASTSAPGPRLTHLDKIYWAEEKMTKGDLIDYYRQISATLLPHLKDRPESLRRQPHGIADEGFFHKDLIGHHPKWVEIERIFSESSAKSIDYLLCQNEWTLLYMINLGCIELNPWLSRRGSLDRPDATVIDLDPDGNAFSEVIEVALEVHRILTHIGAAHHCKTSGATGLHIYIPLRARYNYEHARKFAEAICRVVHRAFPMLTSLERSPAKRRKKIYLDYLQNAQGQTVAAPYSVRPRPLATVSTPLLWEELTPKLRPEFFTIRNTAARIQKVGDLWQPTLTESADLEECTRRLIELDGGDLLE